MDARRVGLAAVFLALLSVFLARPVLGQSTTTAAPTTTVTTTTATTSTTLPPGAGLVTCVVESDSVYVNGPYHIVGHCIMSPGYADGGDGFGAGTIKDVGKALCNSPQRVPIVVLVEAAHPAPATTNWLLFDYEHGTRKIRAFDPKLGTEVVAGTDLSAYTIRFRADCR